MSATEGIGGRSIFTAALSLIIWAAFPDSGHADVKITLTPEGAQLEANDATIEELLSALRAEFGLTFHIATHLEQRVDGIYAGPLRSIVRQVLTNYDHVLRSEDGEFFL